MITAYSHVKISTNTIVGNTVQALSTRDGTKLTRVTADGRDDLVIEQPGKAPIHMDWSQVKGARVASDAFPMRARGVGLPTAPPKLSPEAQAEADYVPKDDKVRVTRPRKAKA